MTTLHSPSALPTRPRVGRLAGVVVFSAALLQMMPSATSGQEVDKSQPPAPKTWSNVMYLGGVAGIRGKSLDWKNTLTVSATAIRFEGTGKQPIRFEISTASVRALDYSGHKRGNAETGGTISGLAGALLGSSIKSTDHYVLLEYLLPDGSPSAVLLRLHKDNQQEIIAALRGAIPPTEPGPAPKACRRLRYGDTAGPGIADRSGSSRERIG